MTHDNIRAALAELVALKDLKERFIKFNPQFHWTPEQEREHAGMMLDYERRQHLAWAAARSALSASTQPEGRGEAQRRVHAAGLRALILSIRDLPPGAGTAAMKSLDALEFATPPDRTAASETNGRTELELEQARRIFDLEAQVTSLMEERDIERRAAASAETDSDWPVMPPSLGQSPVLFEDGYAEGWAKCLSECQRVAALAKPNAWTITAPDGRHWSGDSPLKAAAAAQRDTIDPVLAMARINAMVDEENAIRDKELAEAFERGRAAAQAGREQERGEAINSLLATPPSPAAAQEKGAPQGPSSI